MRRSGLLTLAACLLVITSGPAMASGFSIYEQSARASGQAGAWAARADDAAANWYNPASLVRLDGMEVQFGANLITIGSDTELTSSDIRWGLLQPTTFQTVSSTATPIHLYFSHKINERMAWGIGINTPFGLLTEWEDVPVTLSAKKSELVSFAVNPNFAFAINETWSIALGVDYIFADVPEFSRDLSLTGFGIATLGESNLSGDGSAWGWNAALLYDGARWNFGLTYRSELSPEIEGTLEFSEIPDVTLPGPVELQSLFPNQPGKTTLNLPAQAAIGVAWDATEKLTFEFDITWAGWSAFEEIFIEASQPTEYPPGNPVVDDIILREDWEDTQAYRLGVAWKLAERHELRFGALTDKGPVPLDTLRPSIPDADRKSVTFGYGYMANRWGIDAYYMPLWFDDITAQGAASEGVINGEYTSFVHLAGVTFKFRF
jgi:long-chain fatty acid transport protein